MRITKPAYFDRFRCVASACPDSCCKEWEVQVDERSAAFYRSLSGPLGDRLRQVLRTEDGETVMSIEDGRCPMWRRDGLCRIQAELGQEALCRTCREFPRLRHDYGDFMELGLELSCPEAAKWILEAEEAPQITLEVPGGQPGEYDAEAMAVLKHTRQEALLLAGDRSRPMGEVLGLLLLYGCEAQARLDGDEGAPFDPEAALASARELAREGSPEGIRDFFLGLEILTPLWRQRLLAPQGSAPGEACRPLLRYFIQRHWLQAVSDYDIYCRVKFMVIACLLIAHLGGSFRDTAQLFSKEIENSWENLEAVLDGAYAHPAFTDDKLLGLCLERAFGAVDN